MRMKLLLPLLSLLSAAQCSGHMQDEIPQVNNAWRCNTLFDPRENFACRKKRSINLFCRDISRCQYGNASMVTETFVDPSNGRYMEVLHCKDEDVARRVGMTCNSFPFYNGGYPMLAKGIDWDDEWEHYECQGTNFDGNVCMSWTSHEQSHNEYEVGYSNCTSVAKTELGYKYCKTWKTKQRETKKCDGRCHGCSPNCSQPTFCLKKCCRDAQCYDCSYTPHMEIEFSEAECTKVNDVGACLEWKQEGKKRLFNSYLQGILYERMMLTTFDYCG